MLPLPVKTFFFLIKIKAYQTVEDSISLIEQLVKKQNTSSDKLIFYIACPLSFILPISKHFDSPNLKIGSDMMPSVTEKSFTALISIKMLQANKAAFVLIGSSEERQIIHNENLENKVKDALKANIKPIFCVGETLQEYEDGLSKKILSEQLNCLNELSKQELLGLNIMYDVSWITSTAMEVSNKRLNAAYQNFESVLNVNFEDDISSHFRRIYPAPALSPDLSEIMQSLSVEGFFLGLLTPKNCETFMENLPLEELKKVYFSDAKVIGASLSHEKPSIENISNDQQLPSEDSEKAENGEKGID